MRSVLKLSRNFKIFKASDVEDFSDRLNYRMVPYCLVLFALLIFLKQYSGSPISCVGATNVGGTNFRNFIRNFCFVEGTIAFSDIDHIPTTDKEWASIGDEKKISYYQWVPCVLLIQSLFFYLPHILWKIYNLNQKTKEVGKLIAQAKEAQISKGNIHEEQIMRLAKSLETLLFENNPTTPEGIWKYLVKLQEFLRRTELNGTQFFLVYIFVKLLSFANSVGQICAMTKILLLDQQKTGPQLIRELVTGQRNWKQSLIFPRISYCLVPMHALPGLNHALVQCVMPINMLHEKMYIFLYMLFSAAAALSAASIVRMIINHISQLDHYAIVLHYLRLDPEFLQQSRQHRSQLRKFEALLLERGALYPLKILARSSGSLVTSEIVMQMWIKFLDKDHCINPSNIVKLCNYEDYAKVAFENAFENIKISQKRDTSV